MVVTQAAKSAEVFTAESTDAELAAATRAGDMQALAVLYHRYAQKLMAVGYRLLSSQADAEDVLHDVFVGLPEALRKYDERGRLEPWLKRVAARVALTRLRSERPRQEIDVETAAAVQTRSAEELIALDAAVAALPPSLRAVVGPKEIEGFSHAEIAGMLGISKGASEVRLHRAVAALRALLTKGEPVR